jgi:hypothetical protein
MCVQDIDALKDWVTLLRCKIVSFIALPLNVSLRGIRNYRGDYHEMVNNKGRNINAPNPI